MKKVFIRTAVLEDVTALADLGRRTFIETFAEANTPQDMALYLEEHYSETSLQEELQTKSLMYFVAVEDSKLVGFAKLNLNPHQQDLDGKVIEIARLYVLKEKHGSGVGRDLMLRCLNFAEEKHCTFVWLGVWEHNHAAISFYERFGFERFGQHNFMLGKDLQTDFLYKKKMG